MRLWHQSFTVLEKLPDYADALGQHMRAVARPDTEIVLHGMHEATYETNYPGTDIRHAALQYFHGLQFITAGLAAEKAGFDGFMISTLPDPTLRETQSLLDIPVVSYGETAMHTACLVGRRFGILVFIEDLVQLIEENVARAGLRERCAGVRYVGFGFNDVLAGFASPAPLLARFEEAAKGLIASGADVIIPGEAPLCVLLGREGVRCVEEAPIVDSVACLVKAAETMVDLRRHTGLAPSRRGYYKSRPPPERVAELVKFYGFGAVGPKG
jgi:Asp/Glu/hydantoin racemase